MDSKFSIIIFYSYLIKVLQIYNSLYKNYFHPQAFCKAKVILSSNIPFSI